MSSILLLLTPVSTLSPAILLSAMIVMVAGAVLVTTPVADGFVSFIRIPCECVDLAIGHLKLIGEFELAIRRGHCFITSECELYDINDVGMLQADRMNLRNLKLTYTDEYNSFHQFQMGVFARGRQGQHKHSSLFLTA